MQRTRKSVATFLRERFTRIMLPYWPVALVLALAYTFLPNLGAGPSGWNPWNWISTITLFPTSGYSALSVAWTLQHELIFYFIYGTLIFFNRLRVGMIVWAFLIAALTISDTNVWPILEYFLNILNLEFIFGIIAADLVLRSRNVRFLPSIFLSLGLVALYIFLESHPANRLLLGGSIAMMLPWACNLEIKEKLYIPEAFVFGGAASYCIYLIHNPLLSLTSRMLHFLNVGWIEAIVLSTLLSMCAGSVYFLIWEKPIMKKCKPKVIYGTK